jgi:hypothetical protein
MGGLWAMAGLFLVLSSGAVASTPATDKFNLDCRMTVRKASGPREEDYKTEAIYAVDLANSRWCLPQDGCKDHFKAQRIEGETIKLTMEDTFSTHSSAIINLESGKIGASYDSAPNGLMNGFITYLAQGLCSIQSYSEAPWTTIHP